MVDYERWCPTVIDPRADSMAPRIFLVGSEEKKEKTRRGTFLAILSFLRRAENFIIYFFFSSLSLSLSGIKDFSWLPNVECGTFTSYMGSNEGLSFIRIHKFSNWRELNLLNAGYWLTAVPIVHYFHLTKSIIGYCNDGLFTIKSGNHYNSRANCSPTMSDQWFTNHYSGGMGWVVKQLADVQISNGLKGIRSSSFEGNHRALARIPKIETR